jgi:hypothetical protein
MKFHGLVPGHKHSCLWTDFLASVQESAFVFTLHSLCLNQQKAAYLCIRIDYISGVRIVNYAMIIGDLNLYAVMQNLLWSI